MKKTVLLIVGIALLVALMASCEIAPRVQEVVFTNSSSFEVNSLIVVNVPTRNKSREPAGIEEIAEMLGEEETLSKGQSVSFYVVPDTMTAIEISVYDLTEDETFSGNILFESADSEKIEIDYDGENFTIKGAEIKSQSFGSYKC